MMLLLLIILAALAFAIWMLMLILDCTNHFSDRLELLIDMHESYLDNMPIRLAQVGTG